MTSTGRASGKVAVTAGAGGGQGEAAPSKCRRERQGRRRVLEDTPGLRIGWVIPVADSTARGIARGTADAG